MAREVSRNNIITLKLLLSISLTTVALLTLGPIGLVMPATFLIGDRYLSSRTQQSKIINQDNSDLDSDDAAEQAYPESPLSPTVTEHLQKIITHSRQNTPTTPYDEPVGQYATTQASDSSSTSTLAIGRFMYLNPNYIRSPNSPITLDDEESVENINPDESVVPAQRVVVNFSDGDSDAGYDSYFNSPASDDENNSSTLRKRR